MSRKWIKVPGVAGAYVRRADDGEWEGRHFSKVGKVWERNRETARQTAKDPKSLDSGPLGKMVASYPQVVADEIQQTCGNDPEKKKMFLRDHPEWLIAPQSEVSCPPKRTVLLAGDGITDEEWERVFPKKKGEANDLCPS